MIRYPDAGSIHRSGRHALALPGSRPPRRRRDGRGLQSRRPAPEAGRRAEGAADGAAAGTRKRNSACWSRRRRLRRSTIPTSAPSTRSTRRRTAACFLRWRFYEGETLKQRIARGAAAYCRGARHRHPGRARRSRAHDAGIIHRDIKPANIFLCARPGAARRTTPIAPPAGTARCTDETARVKLLDFGIAKLSGQTGVTRTGTTSAPPAYMAPEHVAGHAIDERADVWSLGIVLYELLAGKRPFDGDHELALIMAIDHRRRSPMPCSRVRRPARLDGRRRDGAPEGAGERYASAHDLLHDLEALRAPLRATATTPRRLPPRRAARTGERWWWPAAAAIVAAAGGWLLPRSTRSATRGCVAPRSAVWSRLNNSPALSRLRRHAPDSCGRPGVREAAQRFLPADAPCRPTRPAQTLHQGL